jgi:HEPN domain-containing protein
LNCIDFQNISEIRIRESKALLDAGFPDGAYYLAGYAVECALKACIAKRTLKHDFPDKDLANKSHTHDLGKLMQLAELKDELDHAAQVNSPLEANRTIVQSWSETSRYQRKTVQEATELILAIEDREGGLLPWIMQRW